MYIILHPGPCTPGVGGRSATARPSNSLKQQEARKACREARELIGSDSEEEDELNDLDEDGVDENATDEDDDEEGDDIYTIGGRPVMRLRSAGRSL